MPVEPVVAYDLENVVIANPETSYTTADYLVFFAAVVAILVSLVFALRFAKNLWQIRRKIKLHEKVHIRGTELILLDRAVVPYSFMNRIFVGKADYEQGRVEEAVLLHELAHVRQKHSWDILFIEFLQIFTWFNPVLYLYKKAIRTNHEFLADDAALQQTKDVLGYQQVLLQSIYVNNNIPLASSFYFFTTKKRILMLHKTFKRKIAVWAGVAVLPLLALLLFIFSSKTYAQVNPGTVKKTAPELEYSKEKASSHMIREYQAIIDKYVDKGISSKFKGFAGRISDADKARLVEIYKSMNKEQRDQQEVGFMPALKPFEKNIPTKTQLESWKNGKIYGVWIDGKRVANATLSKYDNSDFSHVFVSKLSKNAVNYGKHYYQVDLMTHDYFDKVNLQFINDRDKPMMFFRKTAAGAKNQNIQSKEKQGASQNELAEYNAILKEMRVEREDGRKSYKFIDGKTQRAAKIYSKMTIEQQRTVEMLPPPPPPPPPSSQQKGASQKEMEEYNAILKEMRVEREDGRKSYKFIEGKTPRAAEIYKKMTEQQRAGVEMLPPPPPPPSSSFSSDPGWKESSRVTTNRGVPPEIRNITFIFLNKRLLGIAEIKYKDGRVATEDVSTHQMFIAFEKKYNVKFYYPVGKYIF